MSSKKIKRLKLTFIVLILLNIILGLVILQGYITSLTIDRLLKQTSSKLGQKEYKSYIRTVEQVAQRSQSLEVSHCILSPRIVKTPFDSPFTLTNSGDSPIYIRLLREKQIRVDAHQSTTISLFFIPQTPIAIGIGCSSQKNAAGILYVY